jgi:hypothetical protein
LRTDSIGVLSVWHPTHCHLVATGVAIGWQATGVERVLRAIRERRVTAIARRAHHLRVRYVQRLV